MNSPARPRYAVTFEMTPEVISEAARLSQAKMYRVWAAACLLIAASGVVVVIAGANFTNAGGLVVVGWALVAWGVLLLAVSQLRALDRWFLRRQLGAVVGQRAEMTLSDHALTFVTPVAESTIRWDQVTSVVQSDRIVVFQRDRILLAYAPASAFEAPHQREEMIAFARARIATATSQPSRIEGR